MFTRLTNILSRLNLHLHTSRHGKTFQAWLRRDEPCDPIASFEVTPRAFQLGASVQLRPDADDPVLFKLGVGPLLVFIGLEHASIKGLVAKLAPWLRKDWYGRPGGTFGAAVSWDPDSDDVLIQIDANTAEDGQHGRPLVYAWAKNLLLGKAKYSAKVGPSVVRTVHLAEGAYALTVTPKEQSWQRPRWPLPSTARRFEWSVFAGAAGRTSIPVPGKGENDHDLDEDGVSGGSMCARDPEQVCGGIVGDILRTRLQRGGATWVPETPIDPAGAGGPNQAMSA